MVKCDKRGFAIFLKMWHSEPEHFGNAGSGSKPVPTVYNLNGSTTLLKNAKIVN
jgi:hypothetical protein